MGLRLASGVVFLFLVSSIASFAQVISTAQIRGTVQDPSGAAIAGATVTLTQTSTGAVRTATSAPDGTYSLPDLPIGSYRMEVTQSGFTKYVQTGIVLQVGASPTMNVTLRVGAVTQEVQVNAQAAMVQTQSEGVGEVTPPQQVQDLPLNGRQLTDLLPLAGAVGQGRSFRASYPSSAVISIAGGAQGSVAYWLDGGTHNDPLSNQNLPLPFPDTVEEFKVETSSLPAQYGTHPSGAVNVVTKSGTNSFHGDVFEYLRNDIFDSRNTSFAAASPYDYPNPTSPQAQALALAASPRDNLKRNQFGGTIGGPIKKDKLFFFLGWQDTIQRSTVPAQLTIPTDAMLQGNFTAYKTFCDPGLNLGAPYVNNVTSPSNLSPVILALESHMPHPSSATDPCGFYNYQSPVNFDENQGLGRIDYHSSNKNTFFARYFVTNWDQQPGANDPNNLIIASIDGAADRVQNLTLGDTYLVTTNIVNSVHATGNRSRNLTVQNSSMNLFDIFAQAGVTSGINLYQLAPPNFPKYMANFGFGGFGGLFNSTPSLQPYDTLEFSDDVAWSHGAHQVSFGVDFINLRAFAHNYLFNQGDYTFDGSQTSTGPPTSSVGLADFVLGETALSNGFSQDAVIPSLQHQNVFALYLQDAWKATRNLTITAGLRWDPFFGHTVPGGVDVVSVSLQNIINCPNDSGPNCVHSKMFPNAPAGYLFPGDPGGPQGNKLTPNALDKWSPRIGLAWDPTGTGRMAIRAGFGIFYDFPNFSYDQFGFEQPWGGAISVNGTPCASFPCNSDITNPWSTLPQFTDSAGGVHPAGTNPFGGGPGSGSDYVGQGPAKSAYLPNALVFSYPANSIKPTYVMQYNLSIEKQVGKNWLLSISYLGNGQRHLWGNNEANPSLQGPCPGAYPNGYPLPAGVTCTAPGGGGNTIAGPCPTTFFGQPLPPFVCGGIFGPGAALNSNRLLYHYNNGSPVYLGSLCGAPTAVAPSASCYGETLLLNEEGTGNYNGMLLSAQHQFGNHFTSTTNYTWSHCISDNYTTTLGFFLAAQEVPYYPKADRGNCPNADTRNIFNESLVAESPTFAGHWTEMLLGHWGFSTSILAQSGTDISSPSIVLDFSGNGNGPTGGLDQRPNLVGPAYCHPKGRTCWLQPSSYTTPAPYTFGNLGNNSLYGPGAIVVNTGLWRDFKVTEGSQIEFKWEVFNLSNHANLYVPDVTGAGIGLPGFGQPTAQSTAGLGALNQTINDPRTMQFSLKYSF
jgi:hypothetical protein